MSVTADQLRDLLELGLNPDVMLKVVEIFERDASYDARARAADRSREYRMRRKHKEGGMAASAPDNSSHDASFTQRDGAPLLTSSFLPLEKGKSVEVRKKKERAPRKMAVPLPDDWRPNDAHRANAVKLKLAHGCLEGKAEDMRIWARSNGHRKVDWDQCVLGFLRTAANGGQRQFGAPQRQQQPSFHEIAQSLGGYDETTDARPGEDKQRRVIDAEPVFDLDGGIPRG